jgi:hypothetical protein
MEKWIKPLRKHIAETISAIWDFTAGLTVTRNNIKNVSTAGIQIKNDTAADAVNTIQQSGYNSWKGASWNSGTSASNTSEWKAEDIPANGATPYGVWVLSHSQNGAAFIKFIQLDTYGDGVNTGFGSLNLTGFLNILGSGKLNPQIFRATDGTATFKMQILTTSGNAGFLATESNHPLHLGVNNTEIVFINTYGLGIGAASAGEKCEVTGAIKSVYVSDTDSDTDDVLSTGITTKFGLVLIKETTANKFCLFRIKGDNSIPIIIDGDAEFTVTKDNASTYNFYYETDQFKLQNNVGDNKALYVGLYLV